MNLFKKYIYKYILKNVNHKENIDQIIPLDTSVNDVSINDINKKIEIKNINFIILKNSKNE